MSENYPLDHSKRGDNAHYLYCDTYAGRPGYATCLNVIDKEQRGNNRLRPECGRAMSNGECPAFAMRKQEEAAGHALYYVPRSTTVAVDRPMVAPRSTRAVDKNSDSYKRGWNKVADSLYGGRNRYDDYEPRKRPAETPYPKTQKSRPAPVYKTTPAPVKKSTDVLSKASGGYADAITTAAKGQSLIERARNMRRDNND